MRLEPYDIRRPFERGVVILSFDAEQIWGYLDLLSEVQFRKRYPGAVESHRRLLEIIAEAGVSATWFLVGAMALSGSDGPADLRMAGLPMAWRAKIPAGTEGTKPLLYGRSFVDQLRKIRPCQEIGLHGGLTHFIWTNPLATRENVEWELAEGIAALQQAGVRPLSFSFGREQEVYHTLLPAHGIRCYRGRTVSRAFQLGRTFCGALARLFDELRRATPPPVWPEEMLPGLWNIPSSLFLYPIRPCRTSVVRLQSRLDRFSLGIAAAARHRGIFHFCLHPENLVESPHGFSMFEDMLEKLILSRDRGDVEVLTMSEVAARMERGRGSKPLDSGRNTPIGPQTRVGAGGEECHSSHAKSRATHLVIRKRR